MKKLLFTVCFISIAIMSYSQGVSVNENGAPADPSAILDISSQTKAVLVTRLRTSERENIQSPQEGLFTYDIDTRSFWYYSVGSWHEFMKVGDPVVPMGPASGDLSGSYPAPTVSKIQNLDVAFGVPFDLQVLKWDAINNQWKGRNDSLFLPYNSVFSSPTSLFGITNNSSTGGASAIYGKRGSSGSGITPASTMGVWGDNSNGVGVMGTSNTGIGTYGFSFVNHGVYGYSTTAGFAGVKGSHANAGGYGVMGEIQNSGSAIFGLSTGATGRAATFQNSNASNTDSTMTVSNTGLGLLSQFSISNTSNNKAAVDITHAGTGPGLKVRLNKVTSNANGVDVITQGTGFAFYGKSDNGTGAKFENTNAANTFPVTSLGNNGMGSSLYINSTNTGQTSNVVQILNAGSGFGFSVSSALGTAGLFTLSDINTTNSAIIVQQQGLGKGVEINLSKATNTQAGLYVNTLGTQGVVSTANAANAVAVSGTTGTTTSNAIGVKGTTGTNASNGIGVLGQAGVNDANGIGVKGIAGGAISGGVGVLGIANEVNPNAIAVKGIGYTHNEDVGAVTGLNMTDGVGVYGEALGDDGIGVAGRVGTTGNNSVAAAFTNVYANNNRAVMELISNGKGSCIFSDNSNLTNASPMLHIKNAGTGQFLRFETNLGDIRTTISKEGNMVTDGTITVKSDKGIVRSSTGTQLRTEIVTVNIPAGSLGHYNEFNSSIDVVVNFASAFSSAPAVYIGNVVSGSLAGLTTQIEDVTTTGFHFNAYNYTPYDFNYGATTYKIVAIGAE